MRQTLTDKQYEVLLYIRNRELGTPTRHPLFALGVIPFLRKAGYIEVSPRGYQFRSPGFKTVTFLGHVAIVDYEQNRKEKNGSEINRQRKA